MTVFCPPLSRSSIFLLKVHPQLFIFIPIDCKNHKLDTSINPQINTINKSNKSLLQSSTLTDLTNTNINQLNESTLNANGNIIIGDPTENLSKDQCQLKEFYLQKLNEATHTHELRQKQALVAFNEMQDSLTIEINRLKHSMISVNNL